MKRAIMAMLPGLILAGCVSETTVAPRPARPVPIPVPVTIPNRIAGLDGVIGQNAAALTRAFGQPVADVREGTARKLQFSNATCVLDAYLYPKGKSDPLVTHVDARQNDGSPIDRASCVAALNASHGR